MNFRKTKTFILELALIAILQLLPAFQTDISGQFANFVTARNGKLYDGAQELRFVSMNVPFVDVTEDDNFNILTPWEQEDILKSISQLGGQVIRRYALTTKQPNKTYEAHVQGPNKFSEAAFRAFDNFLALCNQYGIRVIVPFVDQYDYNFVGGIKSYESFRGVPLDDGANFMTNMQIRDDFKATIRYVLNRTNTVTGVKYKDDKAILAWETGNELWCENKNYSWVADITAYIKSIDANHLVIDGDMEKSVNSIILQDAAYGKNVDIMSNHFYPWSNEHSDLAGSINNDLQYVRNVKPYIVGEFGLVNQTRIHDILVASSQTGGAAGAMIWSFRGHRQSGGFWQHQEGTYPGDGVDYWAYHWPGFAINDNYWETAIMQDLYNHAYSIRGLTAPAKPIPGAPVLLPINYPGNGISWSGSAGATAYDVQRSTDNTNWTTIATNVSDMYKNYGYPALYQDPNVTGTGYYYRIIAKNSSGSSAPSNVVHWGAHENASAPASFGLTAPASKATNVAATPAFSWQASARATSYRIIVSEKHDLSNPIVNVSNIATTSYTPSVTLSNSKTYYWKVIAVNASGSLDAANSFYSFTTIAAPVAVPVSFSQVYPASASTGVSIVPNFSWTNSANAETYSIVVSTNSSLTSPIINVSNLVTLNYNPSVALQPNMTYYWRVTATNAAGSVNASSGTSFTTGGSPSAFVIDNFDSYNGVDANLRLSYLRNAGGGTLTLSLDGTNKSDGSYGLKYDYNVSSPEYCGVLKLMNDANWLTSDKIQFWLKPDNSNRVLTFQMKERNGEYWEKNVSLTGTTAQVVELAYSVFAHPGWSSTGDGVFDKSAICEFSMYVGKGSGTAGTGTIYIDAIKAINSAGGTVIPVTGISVYPGNGSLSTGGTLQLSAVVTPSNATNTAVTWSSSNTSIATVNSTGLVTAIGSGIVAITASSVDGNKTSFSVITVSGPNVPVTGVSVSPATASIGAGGGTQQLTATVSPVNASNKNVSWSSSNTSVATVSSTGLVTGNAAGSAVITVTTQDGNRTATSSITVTNIPVASVSVAPSTASVNIGSTQQLTATITPADATNKNVTWSTSNALVATVNSTGLVTGVAAGTATITVTTQDGNKTSTSAITVTVPVIPVTGVSVSPTSASFLIGGTQQLTATVSPANATNKTVSWSTSNASVATVNSSGLVTGVAAGTATITVTTQDGNRTATSAITVTSSTIPVTGVSVSPTSASVLIAGTQQLTAIVSPANATNKTVSWSTSNASVATVNSSGLVTGVAAGSATITVTTQDGNRTATSSITVTATGIPVSSVSITPSPVNMNAGDNQQLTANILPANATNKNVTWSSNNTSVATINALGMVTGVNPGTATITVTTQDGGKTANCVVYVNVVHVSSVTLSPTSATIGIGGTQQLTPTVLPANATDKSVRYTVVNSAVATVSGTGLVTGVAAGTTTVTVITNDGSKMANCTITVSNTTVPVTGVSVSPTSASVNVGSTQQLTPTVSPANATNKTVSWSTSNATVATVNSSGLVTGVAAGTATITVTTQDGARTATSSITVTTVPVTGVSVSPTSASVNVGATQQLTATVSPANATNKNISWSTSNASVATVNSSGLVSGVAAGSATITVTTQDGARIATSSITVTNTTVPVTSVSVSPTSASINVSGTQQLTATVSPANATNKNVSWSTSNASVATVNSSGLVTGVAAGSATITVTTQDGGRTATSAITVTSAPSTVTIDNFESYGGSNTNLQAAYVRNFDGNSITVNLDGTNKSQGSYGMRYNYTIGSPNFAGVIHTLSNNWTGCNTISFWLKPDGSNRTLTIQFKETSGELWETYYTLSGTTAGYVDLSLSSFAHPGWYSGGNGVIDLGSISEFNIYVNQGSGSTGSSTLYFDDITANYKSALKKAKVTTAVNNTSIEVSLFPNPAKDVLNLLLSYSADYSVVISDVTGKMVYKTLFTGSSTEIDISGFSKGLYFIRIEGEGKVKATTFMKK